MEILNVTTSALQYLREKIIIGELKPRQKLDEIKVSKELGISRPPLREAFRILEKDRMVVNISRRGTYVSDLSIKDFIEVSQIREMIESYSVDLLKTFNIRELPKVRLALNRAFSLPLPINSVGRDRLLEYGRIFLDFHNNLVESTGNSALTSIYRTNNFILARYQYIYFMDGTAVHTLDEHKRILELIEGGNYDQAKQELNRHIDYVVESVRKKIEHQGVF